jgi:hypothetical protein
LSLQKQLVSRSYNWDVLAMAVEERWEQQQLLQ